MRIGRATGFRPDGGAYIWWSAGFFSPPSTSMERSTSDLLEAARQHNSPNYDPAAIIFDHGEGVHLYDRDGEAYLDFLGGIAVNCLGYNHPALTEALSGQAERVLHVSNLFYSEPQIELLERLSDRSFGDRVFLCNSGTEATEAAMKLARRFQAKVAGEEKKNEIVSMEKSFHGRTMGAITATGQPKYHEGFQPLVPSIDYTPFNDAEAAREAITERTAAVIVEPVQGEGGVRPAQRSFLQALRDRCDETGALLIFDEVQTGVGRTGHLFAYEGFGVEPDIMALAKGLGGGMPIGATVATERAFEGWTLGSHASTFGGNPMATTAANTVLETIERDDLCENARHRGQQLREGLEELAETYEVIEDVRGRGLMVGAECREGASAIMEHCFDEGLLLNTAGKNTLRLVPPLIVDESDVSEALTRLDRALDRWNSE